MLDARLVQDFRGFLTTPATSREIATIQHGIAATGLLNQDEAAEPFRRLHHELISHASVAASRGSGALRVLRFGHWVNPCWRDSSPSLRRHVLGKTSKRWLSEVDRCEALLSGVSPRPIHVLDGDGDDDNLVMALTARSLRYVVRLPDAAHLVGQSQSLQVFASRRPCTLRTELRDLDAVNRHPLRTPDGGYVARNAALAIWPAVVELRKPTARGSASTVNLLTVLEKSHRSAAEPICWHLVTSEPLQTSEQIVSVIHAYRDRWLVRAFFTALERESRSASLAREVFSRAPPGSCDVAPVRADNLVASRSYRDEEPGFS